MKFSIYVESSKREILKMIKENISMPPKSLTMKIQNELNVSLSIRQIGILKKRVRE